MTFESFTQGVRQGYGDLDLPSLFIKVGDGPPEPVSPWHPKQALRTKSPAPSTAVPRPGGSSFPSGPIEMSNARISSAVGVLPTPYAGDCALLIWLSPRIITSRRSLRESIVNAPIAGHPPRKNTIVQASYLEIAVVWLIPVFRDFGSRGLHGAQLLSAAWHDHALLPVPRPVEAKPGMRHGICRGSKLSGRPGLPAVDRDVHAPNTTRPRPSQGR